MFSLLLFTLSFFPSFLESSCCFIATPQQITSTSFRYNITLISTLAFKNQYSYDVLVQFPNDYTMEAEQPSSSVPFQCTRVNDPFSPNSYQCQEQSQKIFNIKFAVSIPGQKGLIKATVFNETCEMKDICDGLASTTSDPTDPGTTDKSNGMVDLGPLGQVAPNVFYPILFGVLFLVIGLAILFYIRNRKNSDDIEKQEEEMTKGGNGVGWFGENKVLEDEVDENGFPVFNPAGHKKREKKPTEERELGSGIDASRNSWMPKNSLIKWEDKELEGHKPLGASIAVRDKKKPRSKPKMKNVSRPNESSSDDSEKELAKIVKRTPTKSGSSRSPGKSSQSKTDSKKRRSSKDSDEVPLHRISSKSKSSMPSKSKPKNPLVQL